jgi:hypothetical protein
VLLLLPPPPLPPPPPPAMLLLLLHAVKLVGERSGPHLFVVTAA